MGKVKLDWFKLDCVLDDKIGLIEAEYGLRGFAVLVKLWQKIYGGEGYYCLWNEDVSLIFARQCGESAEFIREVVEKCIKRGIFDGELFRRFSILTSHGIQQRYYDCSTRRKRKVIREEYYLLEEACKTDDESQNADIPEKNADISEKNADISDTEKNRKEKNRKEQTKTDKTGRSAPPDFSRVELTEEERSELVRLSDSLTVERYIRNLSDWQSTNRKVSKKAFVTLRNMIEEDCSHKPAEGKTSPAKDGRKSPMSEHSYDLGEWEQFYAGLDLDSINPANRKKAPGCS